MSSNALIVKLRKWNKKYFASLKLAVFIILSLAVVSTVGTIVESKHDARMAQKLVYHSWWMITVLVLLVINLIAVMIDRWPWKLIHTPFVLAHIGIIVALIGAYLTQKFGVDGSMSLQIGQTSQFVTLQDEMIEVYGSYNGDRFTSLMKRHVDFISHPPKKYPITMAMGKEVFEVIDYSHYTMVESKVVASEKESAGAAIRVQFKNDRFNMTEWVVSDGKPETRVPLGPAEIILTNKDKVQFLNNAFVFRVMDAKTINYELYSKREQKIVQKGSVTLGGVVKTPWMGIELRVIKFIPKAERKLVFTPRETKHSLAQPAVKIRYNGEEHWVGKNSMQRFFDKNRVILFTYKNSKIDIKVPIRLKKFEVGRYQGTMMASSYASDVDVVGEKKDVIISMNNPLKHNGYTFYQASFTEDDSGKPVASILSVNYDPGRFLKYLGSILIVLGSILLFYFKKSFLIKKKKESQ